ncbi:hypothetical protein ACPF8X_35590 [Streptomyces sp. G35A]
MPPLHQAHHSTEHHSPKSTAACGEAAAADRRPGPPVRGRVRPRTRPRPDPRKKKKKKKKV